MTSYKFFAPLLLLIALSACKQEAPQTSEKDSPAPTEKPEGLIELSNAQVKTAGIAWGQMETKKGASSLNVTGELRVHNEHIATVSAWADGVVTELRTGINKPVSKGSVIAVLRQPQLLDWQQEFLETKDRLLFLEAEFRRYKTLSDDNATALKNFQKAESELREAETRRDLLAAKLRMYHIEPAKLRPDNVSGSFTLTAPVSGIITRTFLPAGSAVQAGTPVCEIVDMSQLHADLFVFEKDLGSVKNGQLASIRISGLDDHVIPVTVFSIDPTVDPERKAVRLHATLKSKPDHVLINGAYIEGRIELAGNATVAALPADAVVREGDRHFIFLFEKETDGKTYFRKVEAVASPATDGYLAVKPMEAIPSEALIVNKGAYYVNAQGAGIEAE